MEKVPHRGPPCVVEDDLFGVQSMAQCIDQVRTSSCTALLLNLPQFKNLSGSPKSLTYPASVAECTGTEAFDFTTSESIIVQSTKDNSENHRLAPLCPYSLSPTLVQSMAGYLKTLYEEVLQLQGMIRKGKVMSAWLGMPGLVRMAEIARCMHNPSLHLLEDDRLTLLVDRNQGSRTPPPGAQESELRRRVWWSILELDVQISMHVGRPLAAQVKLGIDRPILSGVNGVYKDLEQSKLDFTQYALEVLEGICTNGDQDGDHTYESLVDLTKLDRLQRMEWRLPQIPKDCDHDAQFTVAVCDYRIELLSLKMMLCCTLAMAAQKQLGSYSVFQKDSQQERKKTSGAKAGRPRASHRDEAYPHQTAVLDSTRAILESFDKVAVVDVDDQYPKWNRFFDAYSAGSILAIAYLREETRSMSDVSLIMTLCSHLQAITNRKPHCHIAGVAARRIGQLLDDIEKDIASSRAEQKLKAGQPKPSVSKLKRTHSESEPIAVKPEGELSAKKSKTGHTEASTVPGFKRRKRDPTSPKQEGLLGGVPETTVMYPPSSQYSIAEPALQGHDFSGHVGYTDDPDSAATSFDASTGVAQYPHSGMYGDQIALNWDWLHPPLAQPQPPLRDFDDWGIPAYAPNNSWQYPMPAQYQANVITEQAAQVNGPYVPGVVHDRSSISVSAPPTPVRQQPSNTNHYYADPQPSVSQNQTAAGNVQSGHSVQSATQEANPWDWVQHQQSLTRRNSAVAVQTTGTANEPMYHSQPGYFQSYDIPTTTGAWG